MSLSCPKFRIFRPRSSRKSGSKLDGINLITFPSSSFSIKTSSANFFLLRLFEHLHYLELGDLDHLQRNDK